MTKEKLGWVIAIVAVLALLGTLAFKSSDNFAGGAPGGRYIEQYLPVVQYNEGINTKYGIDTESTLNVDGAATFGGAASLTSTLKVGSSGTNVSRLNHGTCYLRPYAATIAASSTAAVDCQATAGWDADGASALTGVTDGDFVQATLSTTTAGTTSNGVALTGASASTTQGYIVLHVSNLTGTTFTWPTSGAASGTASYLVTD